MLDERADAAFITEVVALGRPLIGDLNANSSVQEGEFAKTLGEGVEGILGAGKDRRVRVEGDAGPGVFRGTDFVEGLRLDGSNTPSAHHNGGYCSGRKQVMY